MCWGSIAMLGARRSRIQATLTEMYGQRTVPNVFVGGRFVGGGTETVHAL